MLWSGLLLTVLALLVLAGRHAAADAPNVNAKPSPDLRVNGDIYEQIEGDLPLGKVSEWRAKIATQNSFSLSLDANSAAGDQAVTSVNTSADQDVSIQVFGSRSGQSETVTLTARVELQVSTAPCPDFDGDGVVGIPDFLLFVNHFGTSRGDAGYDAKYDLDENGVIGIPDFLEFVNDFGKEVDCSSSDGGTTVTIPDANLRAVITDSLGKASGASITRAEMATLTRIDAPNKGIRNLTGLEHATNLQRLELGRVRVNNELVNSNDISNLSPLSNLTNLTYLDLTSNGISDISSLSNLTNLTTLALGDNSISDISALSNMTNLPVLYLWGNSISDISSLSNLTNLTELSLANNSVSDISSLSNLTNLTELSLGRVRVNGEWVNGNDISNLSPLSNLTNLTYLSLTSGTASRIRTYLSSISAT